MRVGYSHLGSPMPSRRNYAFLVTFSLHPRRILGKMPAFSEGLESMKPGIARKTQQLGMSFSKASHVLRKAVMFRLVQRCGLDICFRCGKRIRTVDGLSLDHKEAWQYSQDP